MQTKASSPTLKEHSFVACQQLCLQLGAGFEPYMLQLMPVVLASIGDTQVAVREAAEVAANAIATTCAPQGVSLIMPALLEAMGDRCASVRWQHAVHASEPRASPTAPGRRRRRACS